jgi:hypothetical protein
MDLKMKMKMKMEMESIAPACPWADARALLGHPVECPIAPVHPSFRARSTT